MLNPGHQASMPTVSAMGHASSVASEGFMSSIATEGEGSIPMIIKATEGKLFGGMPMLSILLEAQPGLQKAVQKVINFSSRPLMFAIAGVSCFFVAVSASSSTLSHYCNSQIPEPYSCKPYLAQFFLRMAVSASATLRSLSNPSGVRCNTCLLEICLPQIFGEVFRTSRADLAHNNAR